MKLGDFSRWCEIYIALCFFYILIHGFCRPWGFADTLTSGTVLAAANQTFLVPFPPTDPSNQSSATVNVTLTADQSTPMIAWATPSAITYGAALSATQLNATASVPGTFVYTPMPGTVLGAGNQTLSVTFTPTDTTDYTSAT